MVSGRKKALDPFLGMRDLKWCCVDSDGGDDFAPLNLCWSASFLLRKLRDIDA